MALRFFNEDHSYKPKAKRTLLLWLKQVALQEGYPLGDINYIFCSDEYLLQVNQQYLQHDFYTDVITFPLSDNELTISGDIFMSIPRIEENALSLGIAFEHEFKRVLVHALLHLFGYLDELPSQKEEMRVLEDKYLSFFIQT
jgi:probable rRNA maturation factor